MKQIIKQIDILYQNAAIGLYLSYWRNVLYVPVHANQENEDTVVLLRTDSSLIWLFRVTNDLVEWKQSGAPCAIENLIIASWMFGDHAWLRAVDKASGELA